MLQIPLPSWPGSLDTLSVWKRTTIVTLEGDDDGGEGAMEFKHIPVSQQLDMVRVCPETAHLVDWEL